mmetsp:Transcript_10150/g.61781  ORF Transcript_10150/g.61781 Transcript_10150/m.61781 type:complete len:97 (+) Transcript_10150:537-827(+)
MFQGHARDVCCCNSDEQHFPPSCCNGGIFICLTVDISLVMSYMRQENVQNIDFWFQLKSGQVMLFPQVHMNTIVNKSCIVVDKALVSTLRMQKLGS